MARAEDTLALACLHSLMQSYIAIAERYFDPGFTPAGTPRPRQSHRFGGEFMVHEGRILKDLGLIRDFWTVDTVEDLWVTEVWDAYKDGGFPPETAQRVMENWFKTTWTQSTPEFQLPDKWSAEVVDGLQHAGYIDRKDDNMARWTNKAVEIFQTLDWWTPQGTSRNEKAALNVQAYYRETATDTEAVIKAMPQEVAKGLRAEMSRLGPMQMMKQIGRYWRGGKWHMTPDGPEGFGSLDLNACQQVVQSLKAARND